MCINLYYVIDSSKNWIRVNTRVNWISMHVLCVVWKKDQLFIHVFWFCFLFCICYIFVFCHQFVPYHNISSDNNSNLCSHFHILQNWTIFGNGSSWKSTFSLRVVPGRILQEAIFRHTSGTWRSRFPLSILFE